MGHRPLTLKCPKCMRGKHGYPTPVRGLQRVEGRERARWFGAYPHQRYGLQRLWRCLDCGHEWWSTHGTSYLDLKRFEDAEKAK